MENSLLKIENPNHKNIQKSLINKELLYNKIIFHFSIIQINEDKLKFILSSKDDNNIEYNNEYNYQNFLKMNKYFKMFDNINDLSKDLITLINDNNLEIINYSDDAITISINAFSRENSNVILELKKEEINDKEKINKLYKMFKDFKINMEIKDKKIIDLENKLSLILNKNENFQNKILNELKEKEKTILLLQKKVNNLINDYYNLKEKEKNNKINQNNILNSINLANSAKEIRPNILDNILKKSNIFQDKEEIKLILSHIPKNICNIRMLYNSKIDKENEDKIKNSYIGKNDIIFLVKTDKLRRFGAYAHEAFENKEFYKMDNKAFLFNLNKRNIFKSKGNKSTIWRNSNSYDSINFGNSDLKIYHNFLKNKSLSYQGNDYDYNEKHYAVSGDDVFNVSSLEIYQVFLDD